MRVTKEPEVRRQEILHTAIRLFCRRGYDQTSISDIAKEMGVSQGLCYRYFPSKESIYDAAVEQYAEYLVQAGLQKLHYEGMTLKEQILAMSGRPGTYAAAEKGQPELYELFHQPGSRKIHDELFLRTGEKLVPVMTEVIQKAKERGETHVSDPETTAAFFIYGQIGMLMRRDIPEEERTLRIQTCLIELLGL